MALFGKGQQSSSFGAKPISSPAKPFSSKPAQSKSAPVKPILTKPAPPKPQKPIPPKPKTLFEEKKDWTRGDFLKRATKDPFSSGGKMYSSYERGKMVNELFPSRRFSTYVSEGEAKTKLRELRGQEYRAKTGAEKSKLNKMRQYLEKETGLQGKY